MYAAGVDPNTEERIVEFRATLGELQEEIAGAGLFARYGAVDLWPHARYTDTINEFITLI